MRINIVITGLLVMGSTLLVPRSVAGQAATVDVNGVSLRYEVEGSGKPLVLIHGWALSQTEWEGQVELLSPHYKVIRYDRRGFGESSGKPDDTADPADLKALLETLGYPRAHILGHSAGGAVALTFAVRYPEMVDGLILFGPGPPADGFGLPWDGADAFPWEEWTAIARTYGIDSLRAAMSPLADMMFPGRPDGARRARKEIAAYQGLDLIDPAAPSNLVEPARIDELRTVRAPTLVIVGQYEMPYNQVWADALTYGITGAKKVVVPGGGHAVNWVEPERFVAEILRFLREAELP